jgi:hypothetical protein
MKATNRFRSPEIRRLMLHAIGVLFSVGLLIYVVPRWIDGGFSMPGYRIFGHSNDGSGNVVLLGIFIFLYCWIGCTWAFSDLRDARKRQHDDDAII